jgi:hypothetical protein
MSQQYNQWQIVHQYKRACELAEKHGFKIKQDEFNKIRIVANKHPYVNEATIYMCDGFDNVLSFLDGYAQHILEVKNT